MNPVLLDVIYAQCGWLRFNGIDRPYIRHQRRQVSESNAKIEGAKKNSQHLKGNAHEVHRRGSARKCRTNLPSGLAAEVSATTEPRNFIHTDVGNVRYWRG